MRKKILLALVSGFYVFTIMSCVSPSSTLNVYYKPTNQTKGFVYGRFHKTFQAGTSAILTLQKKEDQNSDGKSCKLYNIRFLSDEKFPTYWQFWRLTKSNQVLELDAGTYVIKSAEYYNSYSIKVGTKEFQSSDNNKFEIIVPAGKAVYNGDFEYKVSSSTNDKIITYTFQILGPDNNFGKTTTTVKKMYKFLRNIDCISMY